jgi:hypothetical protein
MGGNMTDERSADELRRLASALVEDVLASSDEEILLELEAEGIAAAVVAAAAADIQAVEKKLGGLRLQAAKQALAADRWSTRPRHRFDAAEARFRLASAVARSGGSMKRLTIAARAGENIPDDDLDGLIQDAEELGIDLGGKTESEHDSG